MKKILFVLLSSLATVVLLSPLNPPLVVAHDSCPATHPTFYYSLSSINPSLCLTHGTDPIGIQTHYCCESSKVNTSCSVSNQTADGFTFCTGGFVTKDELKEHTIFLIGQDPGSVCRQDYPLRNTPDSDIPQDPSGYYYTCPVFSGLIGDCRNNHIYVAKNFTNPLCGKVNVIQGEGPTIPVYDPECVFDNPEIPEGEGIRQKGIKTALGCLSVNPEVFVNTAMPWAVGIGAGIAFLLGVFGAAMITLSAGNPEKMQAGKEMITSAIGGLILIMFAVFILKIIGVDILKLF